MVFRQVAERAQLHVGVVAEAAGVAVLGQALVGDDLREDGDGDLAGGDRADVEADGRADLLQPPFVKALLLQHFQQPPGAAAGADHAEVSRFFSGQERAQTVGVVPVPAGDDHHVVKGRDLQAPDAVFKAVANHLRSLGKAGPVGKIRPVVNHADRKAAARAEGADRQRDMPAAQHDQPLLRQYRLPDGEGIAVPYGGDAGKAPPVGVGDGHDLRQAAAQPGFDFAGPALNDRFQRYRCVAAQLLKDLSVDVFHA